MQQVLAGCVLVLLLLAASVHGQQNPAKGQPILIKPGQVAKLTWKPAPPHPDVVMCCGGALQLSWSPLDSGVVSSVVLNVDNSCPNSLQNQEYVKYLFQAQPKGLVNLDFKQNGDYYISCAVAEHCSAQGMQFLLAVRGCPTDNSIYTPVVPLNVQCGKLGEGLSSVNSGPSTGSARAGASGSGFGNNALGSVSGLAGLSDAPQQGGKRTKSSAAAASVGALATAAAVAAAALL